MIFTMAGFLYTSSKQIHELMILRILCTQIVDRVYVFKIHHQPLPLR